MAEIHIVRMHMKKMNYDHGLRLFVWEIPSSAPFGWAIDLLFAFAARFATCDLRRVIFQTETDRERERERES